MAVAGSTGSQPATTRRTASRSWCERSRLRRDMSGRASVSTAASACGISASMPRRPARRIFCCWCARLEAKAFTRLGVCSARSLPSVLQSDTIMSADSRFASGNLSRHAISRMATTSLMCSLAVVLDTASKTSRNFSVSRRTSSDSSTCGCEPRRSRIPVTASAMRGAGSWASGKSAARIITLSSRHFSVGSRMHLTRSL